MKLPQLMRAYRRLRVQLESLYAMPTWNDNRISDITHQLVQVERALALHRRLVGALSDDFETEEEPTVGEKAGRRSTQTAPSALPASFVGGVGRRQLSCKGDRFRSVPD